MDAAEADLVNAARALAVGTKGALAWAMNPANASLIGERRSVIERDLRRCVLKATRLENAATRPMAVAVFGPSQAGKSHLISVLARKSDPLLVSFPDGLPPADYIREINPDRGKEATGLVSRFTTRKYDAPAGFPVALDLLSPTDIIKILANSYFFEGNPSRYETFPKQEEIRNHINEFQTLTRAGPDRFGLAAEDVWDVAEYLDRYVPESELTKRMVPFWEDMAAIAGHLPIGRAADLWSILWGRHGELTALFRILLEAHAKLDFVTRVFCPREALNSQTARSILDVESLLDLGTANSWDIAVSTVDGRQTRLPRAVITALTAEVRFVLTEKPWDFFDHTDLLDFPGYRGRGLEAPPEEEQAGQETLRGLSYHLKHNAARTLQEMLLRGKVEYLFQRYMSEQDITAMILCIKESNMDVKKLPDVVAQWVATTHGSRPQDREGKPTLLFFVFTRFDLHFEEKTSDTSLGFETRFEGRLKASLVDPFGRSPESWVQKWTPSKPFTNCFLMRNPNIKNKAVFAFDGEREISILPQRQQFISQLRASFQSVDLVRRHFPEPLVSFDEMMRLNDGGATHIAKHLAAVCRDDIKPRQLQDRLDELTRLVTGAIAPFYVPTDRAAQIKLREEAAQVVVENLYNQPVQHARFGMFLSGLMLDSADLSDRLYEGLMRSPKAEATAPSEPEVNLPKRPAARDIPLPFKRPASTESAGAAVTAAQPSPGSSLMSRSSPEALARSAMRIWLEHLYRLANDQLFSRDTLLDSITVREIVGEIAKAADRHGLLNILVQDIEALKFIDRLDERLAKTTVLVEHRLNQFVADLGYGLVPAAERPAVEWGELKVPVFEHRPTNWDVSGIGEEPRPFRQTYVADWLHATYQLFIDNARSEAGLDRNTEQNEQLGKILKAFGRRD
jgi:hypothetical protein